MGIVFVDVPSLTWVCAAVKAIDDWKASDSTQLSMAKGELLAVTAEEGYRLVCVCKQFRVLTIFSDRFTLARTCVDRPVASPAVA